MLRHRRCKPFRKRLRISLNATPKVGGRAPARTPHAISPDDAFSCLLMLYATPSHPRETFFNAHAIQSFDREARRVQGHTFVRTRPKQRRPVLYFKKRRRRNECARRKKKGKRRRKKDRRARRAREKKSAPFCLRFDVRGGGERPGLKSGRKGAVAGRPKSALALTWRSTGPARLRPLEVRY